MSSSKWDAAIAELIYKAREYGCAEALRWEAARNLTRTGLATDQNAVAEAAMERVRELLAAMREACEQAREGWVAALEEIEAQRDEIAMLKRSIL